MRKCLLFSSLSHFCQILIFTPAHVSNFINFDFGPYFSYKGFLFRSNLKLILKKGDHKFLKRGPNFEQKSDQIQRGPIYQDFPNCL